MKDSQQAAHTGIEKSHKRGHAFISFHQSIHDVTANIQLVKVDVQSVEEKYKVYTRYRQAGARYSMNTIENVNNSPTLTEKESSIRGKSPKHQKTWR
ncbi:hypothetical protein [Bacillus haynesii]|uniref:hypothetical protein n=1 Tax=Bacillus haynesii TaxID=1925021 RepID=UPI0035E2A8EC